MLGTVVQEAGDDYGTLVLQRRKGRGTRGKEDTILLRQSGQVKGSGMEHVIGKQCSVIRQIGERAVMGVR
jgi:hypothetical protein